VDAVLSIRGDLPGGFLSTSSAEVHRLLPAPTLIHLPGRRARPLFVSVLLHGNEDTGLKAMQGVLAKYESRELPRAVSLFVGNVDAAAHGVRRLEGQPDYNRVWPDGGPGSSPEQLLMGQVTEEMRARQVFASIDIHNNTGLNPLYACVSRLDPSFLQLASLFSRIVVHFRQPRGTQAAAFAELCPAVTLECGKPGNTSGEVRATELVEAVLNLDHVPEHRVARSDLDLYRTVGVVKVPEDTTFTFGEGAAQVWFERELDHYNFRDLPAGTRFAYVSPGCKRPVEVWDESGHQIAERYFEIRNSELRNRRPIMAAMLTLNEQVIRQDCLCYLMVRLDPEQASAEGSSSAAA
jgi:succinylglutamate desuccinylase